MDLALGNVYAHQKGVLQVIFCWCGDFVYVDYMLVFGGFLVPNRTFRGDVAAVYGANECVL